ncbi:MAG TPA: POTRA domain-containing protein [Acidobacteriaceae bacterium]
MTRGLDYRSCMRLPRAFRAFAAFCLCAFPSYLPSQTRVLPGISFSGSPAYSQAELLAFTGLKPGSSATQEQLDDAAQRLNDTGLFDEVNFSGNDQGIVYTLKPVAATAMLPARFANFVWWQDAEIDRALKARVALYRGDAVPIGGNLRQSVAAALKAMLAEKGIANAAVASRRGSTRPNGPLDHVVFAIDSPAVVIHSLTLAGASPGMRPRLDGVVKDITGQQWDKDGSFFNIESRVGDAYRDQGYLDIALAKQESSAPAITASGVELDLMATFSEGAQYHVKELAWGGSEFLSAADFNRQAVLKVGDADSPSALRESLRSLTNAYGAKGYIDAKISAPPVVDRVAHQVAYTVGVEPGPQYHFRSVRWPSVSTEQAKKFDAAWTMKAGDVYDSGYLSRFLSQNKMLTQQGYAMNVSLKRDPSAVMVDLSVTFTKAGQPPLQ